MEKNRDSQRSGMNRRRFLDIVGLSALSATVPRAAGAELRPPLSERPEAAPHTLVTISGAPRERGRTYGLQFADPIREFLNTQIYGRFSEDHSRREKLLRYAAACLKPIKQLSTELIDELEGMAEGSGLRLEEHVLILLHEELWHGGIIPAVEHCTAVAVGPPATRDGKTYVGQSWD